MSQDNKITVSALAFIIEKAGLDMIKYSGRGMFGASCIGVTLPAEKVSSLGLVLLKAAIEDEDAEDVPEMVSPMIRLMDQSSQDQMGRDDVVVYWPHMRWDPRICGGQPPRRDDACPGCGCEPGDGLTLGCDHPEGCGHDLNLNIRDDNKKESRS